MSAFLGMTSAARCSGGWRNGRGVDGRPAGRTRRRTGVLLEKATLGDGASSRAAGMVRAQGGTETAIVLGLRTQDFYAASGDRYPLDCGFVAQGYLMPCFSDPEVAQAHDRIALQKKLGLNVEWLSGSDVDNCDTGMAPGVTLGVVVRAGRRLHRRTAQCAGLHRGADSAAGRRPGALPVHRPAHRGWSRGRRRHLRRADRHRTRRAHRRAEARRSRYDGGRAGCLRAERVTRWLSPHR